MIRRARPLLCELHAHTTWSDGELSTAELVDLYGGRGFDVLAVTDHVLRADDPWPAANGRECVTEARYAAYLDDVEREAERARVAYGMLVIPGVELTENDDHAPAAGHAVALGLRRFVGLDGGLPAAMGEARALGAAIVAAHPHEPGLHADVRRPTHRFWHDWRALAGVVDRFELFNQGHLFGWVARHRLPAVACGDTHGFEHADGWKTLLPCAATERAVLAYLRSSAPAYLVRADAAGARGRAADAA